MARSFTDLTFTDAVRHAQERYGSRQLNREYERDPERRDTLGAAEIEFIEARDCFYQATVGENGWPYVQHRGGPRGFLRALDEKTLGYADFRGNLQYISVGNLNANGRVAMILMDYAHRRRLKIWAQARIVHEHEAPELLARLRMPGYRATVERAVLLEVRAYDWNCPQHIVPRYTANEIESAIRPLETELAEARAEIERLRHALQVARADSPSR